MGPLFVAIILPRIIKSQLQRLCFGLPSVRWIDEEHFHLTLFYIGITEGTLFLDIQEKLSEIIFPPFSLSLSGVSCLHKRTKGTIWADIHPSDPLLQLYKSIDNRLHELPLEKEARSFSPHITLAHYEKINDQRLGAYLEANNGFTTSPFNVDAFALMSSEKTARHAFYVEHERFPLRK